MHPLEPILIGVLAILVHEVFHYIPHIAMKTKFERFVVSIKSVGFQFSNEFLREKNKVLAVYLFPLTLSSILFIDIYAPRIFIFGVVNLLWSLMDLTTLASLLTKLPDERVDWADRKDEKAREKAIIDISRSS
ncbi:MAG: metalloprotease family protein [Candidatus Saliniplasma sp.]